TVGFAPRAGRIDSFSTRNLNRVALARIGYAGCRTTGEACRAHFANTRHETRVNPRPIEQNSGCCRELLTQTDDRKGKILEHAETMGDRPTPCERPWQDVTANSGPV